MYNLNETIIAVSSPSLGARSIVRITGPSTLGIVREIFNFPAIPDKSSIRAGSLTIDPELSIDAKLYLFLAPHSYTGEDVAEIHIDANQAVVEGLMETLLSRSRTLLRSAGPGEFTARAYLNGKIDLTQAEAVNEIITCSNRLQLAAAEKLLAGRLTQATEEILTALMECLSLIEAGLDFSTEDIEFITRTQAVEILERIKQMLERLSADSIHYESVVDLPAVGIAGAPNAGKSNLLNKLLDRSRSIVSDQRKTTRDVLTGLLTLTNYRCVIFDCAGLIKEPDNILDELAHQAAVKALEKASVVAFCVDISKTDWAEDITVRKLIKDGTRVIPVATKSDLLSEDALTEHLTELNKLFATEFLPTSAVTGVGLEQLRDTIDKKLIELALGGGRDGHAEIVSGIALTTRHRQAVGEALKNINESVKEIKTGNDEVAAMLMRSAYQSLSDIEQQPLDEQILEEIFSRFCIGK
jgi:tRNA modification GTPase